MNPATDPRQLPVIEPPAGGGESCGSTVALVGNPNAGKTSLFNRLTGLRATTGNFPGTTVERRRATVPLGDRNATLVDLPGLYSLEATTPEEEVTAAALRGELAKTPVPDVVLAVVDATHLERNLYLVGQVLELGKPTVVALNMIDSADRNGIRMELNQLREKLSCPVVAVSARTGKGIPELKAAVAAQLASPTAPAPPTHPASCNRCPAAARYDWAESVASSAATGSRSGGWSDAIDRVLTHRVAGLSVFAAVMLLTFMLIFQVASTPMDLIDGLFGTLGELVAGFLPEGLLQSFLVDGVIAGVGGALIFLPQICLLFFMLALLEESGYLARAAFVMDRVMHRFGLPGKAFVPLLAAHACAIPAIMASRVIDDRRDRLATILVAPLMSCSARLPVYVLVVALLFPHDPLKASLLFAGAYVLGIATALVMAFVFRRTLLPGRAEPLLIELPPYRRPSLRNALLLTYDRASVFVVNAGTTILVISMVMWALATFPRTGVDDLPADLQTRIAALAESGDADAADRLLGQQQLERSLAGRLGKLIEPAFTPLGFDWKVSVGVISSFAAREVIVSTLSVLYGVGEDGEVAPPEEGAAAPADSLYGRLQSSTHADGSPVFTPAACLSLLVFYVLAMQCLPTQAVTRRETGSWKWPLLQLGYMTALAYAAGLITYQTAAAFGLASIG